MEDAWKKIQNELKSELTPELYEPFIKPLRIHSDLEDDGNTFVLGVPSRNLLPDLKKNYREPIQTRLRSLMGREISVEFELFEDTRKAEQPVRPLKPARAEDLDSLSRLNPAYTLDAFIRGKSNELAVMAAENVVAKPGSVNPLFVYGDSGLGKTHLVHGIARELVKRDNSLRVLCISIEEFKSNFMSAVKNRETMEFKDRYKDYDVLCIEDIHSLRNTAEATQEEFFYIFNSYFESNRQIIITSEVPASKLLISSRLLSRMISGLQVRIGAPDPALRKSFLAGKLQELDLELQAPVQDYLTTRITGNVRELESALNKFYFLNNQGIDINDMDTVTSQLEELIPAAPSGPIPLENIIQVVSARFGVTTDDILGSSRKSEYTFPRHIAMYLGVRHSNLNKSAIARFFRKNDHTTVINAEKNIKKRLQKDAGFGMVLEAILSDLRKRML